MRKRGNRENKEGGKKRTTRKRTETGGKVGVRESDREKGKEEIATLREKDRAEWERKEWETSGRGTFTDIIEEKY